MFTSLLLTALWLFVLCLRFYYSHYASIDERVNCLRYVAVVAEITEQLLPTSAHFYRYTDRHNDNYSCCECTVCLGSQLRHSRLLSYINIHNLVLYCEWQAKLVWFLSSSIEDCRAQIEILNSWQINCEIIDFGYLSIHIWFLTKFQLRTTQISCLINILKQIRGTNLHLI